MTFCFDKKRSNQKRSASGFTLVEMLIVVAITGILAAIAVPSFAGYMMDSRRAEAILVLGRLHQDQKAIKETKGSYLRSLDLLWGNAAAADSPKYIYGFRKQDTQDPLCSTPTIECYSTYEESDPSKLGIVDNNDIDSAFVTRFELKMPDGTPTGLFYISEIDDEYNLRMNGGILLSSAFVNGPADAYDAVAVGNLDGDDKLDKISISETGVIQQVCDDKTNSLVPFQIAGGGSGGHGVSCSDQ